jgi:hypothetical protein
MQELVHLDRKLETAAKRVAMHLQPHTDSTVVHDPRRRVHTATMILAEIGFDRNRFSPCTCGCLIDASKQKVRKPFRFLAQFGLANPLEL